MSLSSALYSGISGMNTNGTAMSVIGNNIANTNTIGFKSSRTIFSDLLASSVNGSGGTSQVGRGTGLARVDTLFAQGTFETTKSDTDLAIEGEGLFVVREAGSENLLYTRAGSFRFDGEGYLITPEGYRVQGKPYYNGVLSTGGSTDIRVDINDGIPARMTGTINLSTNLDANAATVTGTFDPADPTTYNYAHSTDVYDSLGNTHLLTTYFSKTADNNWDWHVVDENNTTVFSSATDGGSLVFDTSGRQAGGGTTTLGPLSLGAGTAPQSINFALQNTTQYANISLTIRATCWPSIPTASRSAWRAWCWPSSPTLAACRRKATTSTRPPPNRVRRASACPAANWATSSPTPWSSRRWIWRRNSSR